MKYMTFKDTCGQRIDSPVMANIITRAAENGGTSHNYIETKSQFDQALAHLKSNTPESERDALASKLRELNEQAVSSYMSSINPFAARAVEGLINDVKAGRMPDRERIDHVNELASYSQWQDFLATKTIPDSCGIELSEIMAPTVRVVCEALGIPPSSVKTKSQLSHATELLKYSSRDDETNAAIQQQLKEATIATLEDVKTQVSGLGLEAMNKLTALAKGEIMMDTEQIQRLLIGIRRSMFLDLKRQHPDLEQVIAERGDDQAKKFLAELQS